MVSYQNHRADMVRVVGLEPTRLAALEPKSSASANSAIPACNNLFYHNKAPFTRCKLRLASFFLSRIFLFITNLSFYHESFFLSRILLVEQAYL